MLLFAIVTALVRLGGFKRPGLITGVFGIGYAAARTTAEMFREPDGIVWGPITLGMAYSAPMVLIGLGLVLNALRKRPAQDGVSF